MTATRSVLALTAALASVFLIASPTLADSGDSIDIGVTVPESSTQLEGDITNAELRWGLNQEANSGSFAGGCNFLSAGVAGDAGSARVWAESDDLYSAENGEVSIVKATSGGGWEPATFDTKCLDATGTAVSAASLSSTTESQVVIEGGTGSKTSDGGLRLSWSGSFSVVFYGGMTYWSASDPQLVLDASGNGQLTATASGYGASMDDTTKWEPLAARTIVLAQLTGVQLATTGGFAIIPDYLGVSVDDPGQVAQTAQNATYWGSFPASFVDFQRETGQSTYWLSSGGQRDPAKPADLLTVNYDAEAPAIVPGVDGGLESSTPPSNPVTFRPTTGTAAATTPVSTAAAGAVSLPDAIAAVLSGSSPTSLMRDNGQGLVPEAVLELWGPFALPLGGAVLAVLASILLALQLSGHLVLPWSRPRS